MRTVGHDAPAGFDLRSLLPDCRLGVPRESARVRAVAPTAAVALRLVRVAASGLPPEMPQGEKTGACPGARQGFFRR